MYLFDVYMYVYLIIIRNVCKVSLLQNKVDTKYIVLLVFMLSITWYCRIIIPEISRLWEYPMFDGLSNYPKGARRTKVVNSSPCPLRFGLSEGSLPLVPCICFTLHVKLSGAL